MREGGDEPEAGLPTFDPQSGERPEPTIEPAPPATPADVLIRGETPTPNIPPPEEK